MRIDFARIDLVGVDFMRIDLVGAPHVLDLTVSCIPTIGILCT